MLRIVPVPLGPKDSRYQGWELLWQISDLTGGEQLVEPRGPGDGAECSTST